MSSAAIFLGILAIFGAWVLTKGLKIVGQAEVLVVERLGRFHRVDAVRMREVIEEAAVS